MPAIAATLQLVCSVDIISWKRLKTLPAGQTAQILKGNRFQGRNPKIIISKC